MLFSKKFLILNYRGLSVKKELQSLRGPRQLYLFIFRLCQFYFMMTSIYIINAVKCKTDLNFYPQPQQKTWFFKDLDFWRKFPGQDLLRNLWIIFTLFPRNIKDRAQPNLRKIYMNWRKRVLLQFNSNFCAIAYIVFFSYIILHQFDI